MLELRGNELAGGLGGIVAANARLRIGTTTTGPLAVVVPSRIQI